MAMLNMSEISPPNSWCVSAVPVAGPSGLPKVGAVSGSLSYHRPGMPAGLNIAYIIIKIQLH